MEVNLDQKPEKFKVIIGDIKMKFPIFPIINYCPNWIYQISNEKRIVIKENLDLTGAKDFFDGIYNNSFRITINNCHTIAKLALLSGSEEIYKNANKFINDKMKSIPQIMNEIIDEKSINKVRRCNKKMNEIDKENKIKYLSQHYNELLKYPALLKNISIDQHFNILKMALDYYDKNDFDMHGLISFVINLLNEENNDEYSILLSLFDPTDFNIEEIEQLINCKNFQNSFLYFKTVSFISTIKQNREMIKEQNEK